MAAPALEPVRPPVRLRFEDALWLAAMGAGCPVCGRWHVHVLADRPEPPGVGSVRAVTCGGEVYEVVVADAGDRTR